MQGLGVELNASAIAQVDDLMTNAHGDQVIGFGARQAMRHLFEFINRYETAHAGANVAAFEDCRTLRERFVSSFQINGQDANARRQCEIPYDRFEVRHLSRH